MVPRCSRRQSCALTTNTDKNFSRAISVCFADHRTHGGKILCISPFNKQFQIIKNTEMEISDSKSWILGNCRWRAGTQQLLYVQQTVLTLQCSHLMWQGSYAFPKAAPRAYSPWAVIKIRCLLRLFKDKAGERRAMWFTTLLDKSKITLSSHEAPRPFIKYPVLFVTADRSVVLGEKNRNRKYLELCHVSRKMAFLWKRTLKSVFVMKFDFGVGIFNTQPQRLHPYPTSLCPAGGRLLGGLPCNILFLSEGSQTLYWRFTQPCQFVPWGHLVFSHTIVWRRPIRLNFCQVCCN